MACYCHAYFVRYYHGTDVYSSTAAVPDEPFRIDDRRIRYCVMRCALEVSDRYTLPYAYRTQTYRSVTAAAARNNKQHSRICIYVLFVLAAYEVIVRASIFRAFIECKRTIRKRRIGSNSRGVDRARSISCEHD